MCDFGSSSCTPTTARLRQGTTSTFPQHLLLRLFPGSACVLAASLLAAVGTDRMTSVCCCPFLFTGVTNIQIKYIFALVYVFGFLPTHCRTALAHYQHVILMGKVEDEEKEGKGKDVWHKRDRGEKKKRRAFTVPKHHTHLLHCCNNT